MRTKRKAKVVPKKARGGVKVWLHLFLFKTSLMRREAKVSRILYKYACQGLKRCWAKIKVSGARYVGSDTRII